MPRKAKEENNELNTVKDKKNVEKVTKTTTKKPTKTSSNSKKNTKKETSKKVTKSVSKNKSGNAKSASKKLDSTTSKTKSKARTSPIIETEYYDLPFRYNQTVVKILAQTPNILFIYWDISDEDKKIYTEKYGESFFESTIPYLTITNETMNYTFEVEINDFANSWYLHINDSNCKYTVKLARKYIQEYSENNNTNNYIDIATSNELEVPNSHILIDELGNSVFFRNTKTNIIEEKDISSISFLNKIGRVYNIYDLYKQLYKDELVDDSLELNFPSSHSYN